MRVEPCGSMGLGSEAGSCGTPALRGCMWLCLQYSWSHGMNRSWSVLAGRWEEAHVGEVVLGRLCMAVCGLDCSAVGAITRLPHTHGPCLVLAGRWEEAGTCW